MRLGMHKVGVLFFVLALAIAVPAYAPPANTPKLDAILTDAFALAERQGAPEVTEAHFLLAIVYKHPAILADLESWGVDTRRLEDGLLEMSPRPLTPAASRTYSNGLATLLEQAGEYTSQLRDTNTNIYHVLVKLGESNTETSDLLTQSGFDTRKVRSEYLLARSGLPVKDEMGVFALRRFGKDLVREASEGRLHPMVGRREQLRRTFEVLLRENKNSPIFYGEPGVGKSAIVEGLAYLLAHHPEQVPSRYRDAMIVQIKMSDLQAGTKYRGEFAERLSAIVRELEAIAETGKKVILFIDEIHVLMNVGGEGEKASELLKEDLGRGKITVMGATTLDEYRKYIEKDPAFERRFQPIEVPPATIDETEMILEGRRGRIEANNNVSISASAERAAAELSARFIHHRYLPDKAIDLVTAAAAVLELERDGTKPQMVEDAETKVETLRRQVRRMESEPRPGDTLTLPQLREALHTAEAELDDVTRAWQESQRLLKQILETSGLRERLAAMATHLEAHGLTDVPPEKALLHELVIALNLRVGPLDSVTEAEVRAKLQAGLRDAGIAFDESDSVRELHRKLITARDAHAERLTGLRAEIQPYRDKHGLGHERIERIHVEQALSKVTGIPLEMVSMSERDRLLHAADFLREHVHNQDHAIDAVHRPLVRRSAQLGNLNAPIANLMFVGPSGVGKTLLAHKLALFMFGTEDAIIKLDMAEYSEKHTVARLIGAPPGYVGYEEGGQLTERVRRQPYAVVLLDEIEKAHPDVYNMLLGVMEKGYMIDSRGNKISFENVIFIMTTNQGHEMFTNSDARRGQPLEEAVRGSISERFPPWFLGRLDNVVVFHDFDLEKMMPVIESELKKVADRVRSVHGVEVGFDHTARLKIAQMAMESRELGARQIEKLIRKYIEEPLAFGLTNKSEPRIAAGDTPVVVFDEAAGKDNPLEGFKIAGACAMAYLKANP